MAARKLNRYTVYDRHTDLPVMVNGTARECAAAMGVTLGKFPHALHEAEEWMPRRWSSVGDFQGWPR